VNREYSRYDDVFSLTENYWLIRRIKSERKGTHFRNIGISSESYASWRMFNRMKRTVVCYVKHFERSKTARNRAGKDEICRKKENIPWDNR
jgi:hypothetical protein